MTEQSEKSIFLAAIEINPAAERAAFLSQACAGNEPLRAKIEALLQAHAKPLALLDASGAPGATVDEPVSERPGTMIGPYKLLQQIGEGGMGVVWMAEQERPVRRKVALKIIKPGMDSRQVSARFEAERQASALMDHVNIARVLDAGTTESGRPYFVMELIHGIAITKYCDDNQLTPRERLELFVPVCQAIQHAHQKGIIHRDIKPSNVLVTHYDGKPVPKIIDFGVAKAIEQHLTEKTLFTQYGTIIGTFEYMSPEQAEMSALGVDTRSDIYSLGVLLYELLTGSTPLEKQRLRDASYSEIVRLIREEEPPRPSTRLSNSETLPAVAAARKMEPARLAKLFRGELDWIVMKALEKDRNRRYETASAFAADVQRYLADEPVLACPPSAWYRFRKFARRKRTALVMALCVCVALAGMTGGAGWVVRDRAAQTDRQRAREEALDRTVKEVLAETETLIQQGRWPEALAVLDRAEQLLAAAGRIERPKQLLDLRKDLDMAKCLEDIYHEPCSSEVGFFWGREQDRRFSKAFQDFGIDVEVLDTAEAAARIRATIVRPALVQSLDEWAAMRKRGWGEQGESWKKLLVIAQQADGDEWRNRFRESLLRRDLAALVKLAEEVPLREVPPATVYVLGHALNDLGALDKAMAVVQEGHQHHPEDFWLNDALGHFCKDCCRPPRYADALRYYSVIVALRPRNRETHFALAQLLQQMGALEEAIAEYTKSIELSPRFAAAHNNLGNILLDKRQWVEAMRETRTAIELAPNNSVSHNNLSVALRKLNRLDEAVRECRTAIELDPKSILAHLNLGIALYEKNQWNEAVREYRSAIELDPKFVWAHYYLGQALFDKKLWDQAVLEYTKVIELEPNNVVAHCNLGYALDHTNQWEEAIREYRTVIELDPKNSWAYHNLCNALIHLGQWDKAIPQLRTTIKLDPKNASAHIKLGFALWNNKQPDEAIHEYRTAIDLDPKLAIAHINLSNARCARSQWAEAICELGTTIEFDPKNSLTHNALAWLLATCPAPNLRDPRRAVALAKKAVQLAPTDANYWNTLGAAYYGYGEWKSAVQALKKSMDLRNGGNSWDWFYLAMAHWQLGEKEQARQWHVRAVQWMEKNQPKNDELRRFRSEAAELLGIEKLSK